MNKITLLLTTTLCLLQSAYAATAVPDYISFQGRALSASGALMGAGTPVNRTVTLRVWGHATNSLVSDLLYSEQQIVTIAEGEFSVLIGAGASTAGSLLGYSETTKGPPNVKISDAFGAATRYLGVTIDDGTTAVDNEITPRQQFVTSSYAMRAKVAEGVDSGAVTTAMLASNAVTTSQVSDAAITNSKLAANAVTATQIVDATITSTKIAAGTITAGNLAAGAVTSTAILDSTIASADIADSAVTTAKIADGTIASADIADSTITGGKIAASTIPLSALVAAVQNALVPPGTIVAYGGTTAPAGWLLCDGTSIVRADYASLYTAIGNAFGTASGTTFNLPDLRGRFLRGWDNAVGRDPDRALRYAMNTGGNTGDSIGSLEFDANRQHAHTTSFITAGYSASYNSNAEILSNGRNNGATTKDTNAVGGSESRPINANVNYIIKY
jgi:microcystin-dependent protein